MDERDLFGRFHDALGAEPRPGAYERMRFAMSKHHPVVVKTRPAFQIRWPKMGLRIAAVMTAVVIGIALVAAFVAGHPGFVGSGPAAPDPNVTAYQAMLSSDYDVMNTATFNNSCNTIQDTTCQATLTVVLSSLQKWVGDLNSFHTPSRFVVMDGQLRAHLNETMAELRLGAAFQKAGNEGGFNRAMDASFYERAWIDPTMFALLGSYPRVAGTYHDAFRLTRQSLAGCVNGSPAPADMGCAAIRLSRVCSNGIPGQNCESSVQSAATQLQTFLIALLQNPAPSSLTAENALLMSDLAKADSALLAITDALLSGDTSRVATSQNSYDAYIIAADSDANVIGNP